MRVNSKLWFETTEKFYGEGPQQLLQLIDQTGSLSDASKMMKLSYRKALNIIARAEDNLGFKLLDRTIGGASGGGSQLTARARRWMAQYAVINQKVDQLIAAEWQAICRTNFENALIAPLKEQLNRNQPQLVSIIGGGGKTTLLNILWDHFYKAYSTLYTTTTKIMARPDIKTYYKKAPPSQSVALYKEVIKGDKVSGVSAQQLDALFQNKDYHLILCEADGSRGMPFKLHAPHEPVIPQTTTQLFIIIGCDAFHLPAKQAVHRYQNFGVPAEKPLDITWAIDYICQSVIAKIDLNTEITIVFNKYNSYPLSNNIMSIVKQFKNCQRPLRLITAELASLQCYHFVNT